jgi:hypothetical protein
MICLLTLDFGGGLPTKEVLALSPEAAVKAIQGFRWDLTQKEKESILSIKKGEYRFFQRRDLSLRIDAA